MPSPTDQLDVTFMVVVRNERGHIERCIRSMLDQTLDPSRYEILVVDSMSDDGTREVVRQVINEHADRSIRLLDNPGLILSCGWNVGIREARGQLVVRIDAHGEALADFLERGLAATRDHPEAGAVGGFLETKGDGFWGEVIACVLSSKVGVGGGSLRVGCEEGPVDAMRAGMYKREAMLEIGGLDEGMGRNQDNVLHARLQSVGRILYFDPSIRSIYHCRNTLGALWRQMFRTGRWLILVFKHQKEHVFMLRYYVPVGFVLTILLLGALGSLHPPAWGLLAALMGTYVLTAVAVAASRRMSPACIVAFPIAMFVLHFAYGLGTAVGALQYPFHHAKAGQSHPLRTSRTMQETGPSV